MTKSVNEYPVLSTRSVTEIPVLRGTFVLMIHFNVECKTVPTADEHN